MASIRRIIKTPAALVAGSFLIIVCLFLLTSPLNNIIYVFIFFLSLVSLLIGLGLTISSLFSGGTHSRTIYSVTVVSIFLILLLMFQSAGALNLIDLGVLIAITAGLLFYGRRRVQ